MDRDFESKKNGFSANSYIEVLDAHAQYMNDDLVFMQDNASIYTATLEYDLDSECDDDEGYIPGVKLL